MDAPQVLEFLISIKKSGYKKTSWERRFTATIQREAKDGKGLSTPQSKKLHEIYRKSLFPQHTDSGQKSKPREVYQYA